MKNFYILFLVIIFFTLNTTETFAQKSSKSKENVMVVILVPDIDDYKTDFEIPINRRFSRKRERVGFHSIYECGGCKTEEEFKKAKYLDIDVSGDASELNGNKITINLKIIVDDDCKIRKSFILQKRKRTSFKLNCGVNITAFYPLKKRKAK